MDDHVDISVEMNGQQLDLRVPTEVTQARLTALIGQVLAEHHYSMPPHWHLQLAGKRVNLGDYDTIGDFPVGNGDVFTIVIDEQGQA